MSDSDVEIDLDEIERRMDGALTALRGEFSSCALAAPQALFLTRFKLMHMGR